MRSFQLGPWAVYAERHEMVRGDEGRRVGSKVMEVLCCLAAEPGRVVSKEELVSRCWDGAFTSDEALSAVIYELRRALEDDARSPRFVETIRKRGYRLVAPVTELPGEPRPDGLAAAAANPGTQTPRRRSGPPAVREPSDSLPSGVPVEPTAPAPRRRIRDLRLSRVLLLLGLLALLLFIGLRDASETPMPAASPPQEIRSLAVLPASSFSAEGSELALASALTDMLTADLAQVCPLEVAPGISVRQGGSWDLDRVESELGVDAVVEASVLCSGDRYWISVQLVETESRRLLWGASYDRQGTDTLSVLREVAVDAALQVSRALPPLESEEPNLR